MSAWAKPGVKCVCIKHGVWTNLVYRTDAAGPSFNEICTIIDTKPGTFTAFLLLRLAEHDGWFTARRFRPLVTKSQSEDVALFAHYLDGVRIGEPV